MMFFKKESVNLVRKKSVCENNLRRWASLPRNELLCELQTSLQGLDGAAAAAKKQHFGDNVISASRSKSLILRLLSSFINPFNIVLFIVAIITFITDVVITSEPDFTTVVVIVLLIAVSGLIAFSQNEKSNAAAAKLSAMISNTATVLRDGAFRELNIRDIVPGDVVKLAAGDMLPGDIRFLTTKDTFVAQASLSGESAPVEKYAAVHGESIESLTDIACIGFMGTNILSGTATGVVLTIGNQTYLGSMAASLSGDKAKNSFEKGVESVSLLLIRFMTVMVPVIFVVNGFTKGDWGNSFLFALSIAVGLTPEMLPVIMTSTLATGAVSMAKHETIVKNLSAIQTFGEMDVLCTDKTGTLTEDKIILEKYMDIYGREDRRILRKAYLNSYFQTGLKNLMDLAIISRAELSQLSGITADYECVDEIPFDFTRRRMSVVLQKQDGSRTLITKGAVEEILAICKYAEQDGAIIPLTEEIIHTALQVYARHNSDGLRVIAVAQKNNVADVSTFGVSDESELVLIGFIGFLDPPKASAALAVAALREHGVRVMVLTGDSEGVALKVCQKVGIATELSVTGPQLEQLSDVQLRQAVLSCNVFSKLSPDNKQTVIKVLRQLGHTVGYMGDGINDAPALNEADIGISVDTGVDIAKETADIILLKKDLMVLEKGVQEGRRTFGNIMKYIKMAASGNFGNMISVMLAGMFLPFLPMLPIHLLTQNMLCDFSQMGIAFDDVDKEYLDAPRKWDPQSIRRFMLLMGPVSSLFDVACFAVMWWVIGADSVAAAPMFQAGWFVFGVLSQIMVVHMIRTAKLPFIQSKAAKPLMTSTVLIAVLAALLVFTPLAISLDFLQLPLMYLPWLSGLLFLYCLSTQLVKKIYMRRFGEWL